MEVLGEGLMAIGRAVATWATAYGFIYVVGIGTKTFLIYTDKCRVEELKDWFNFGFGKKGGKL